MRQYRNDDISFCTNHRCRRKGCFRHQTNIIHPDIPHSFADFDGTKYCPKYYDKEKRKDGKKCTPITTK